MSEKGEVLMKFYSSKKAHILEEKYSLHSDMKEALSYLEILIEERESLRVEIKESLWNAALISFFRCFGTGVREKLTKELFKPLPGQPVEFFDYLKNLRDKHLAHSVSQLEFIKVVAMLDPNEEQIIGNGKIQIRRVLENQQHIGQLSDLCKVCLNQLNSEIKLLEQEINKELSKIDYSEAFNWGDAVHTVSDPVKAASSSRKKR